MKRKVRLEIEELARQTGCKVLSVKHTNHFRLEVQRPDGTVGMMTHPVSASDHRAIKNQLSHWKHFAAGIGFHERSKK